MSNIEHIVKELELNLVHNEFASNTLSYVEYIKEFRTIGVTLPRQSGLSTAFNILSSGVSCLIFNKCFSGRNSRPNVYKYHSLATLYENCFKGNNYGGLKYTCFYLDNWNLTTAEEKRALFEFIGRLKVDNVLSKDFYLVTGG